MLLDFNTKPIKDKNEQTAVSEHIARSFSLSCPQFHEMRSLRKLNVVWQLFLLISSHVNYGHFQAAEREKMQEAAAAFLHQYKTCEVQKVPVRASRSKNTI